MTRPPFEVLKGALAVLVLALVLASGGIWWSWDRARDAEAAVARETEALNVARQALARSREQQRLLATHLASYQALVEQGFIGDEDRLAWIEAVQRANRDAGLYGLDYRLAPRRASAPALAQGTDLGQTGMTLMFPLLVETDLPRFLSALRQRAPGVMRVQGCALTGPDAPGFEALNRPRLQAECDLQWFTISHPAGVRP